MSFYKAVLVLLLPILVKSSVFDNEVFCGRNGKKLKYVFGDALTDNRGNCIGPQGKPYPAYVVIVNLYIYMLHIKMVF